MAQETDQQVQPGLVKRATVVLLAGGALLHSLSVALWLAPSGPMRDVVGDRRLQSYVTPYFGQAWGALTPNAQYVDESFRVRAQVRPSPGGKLVTTPWIDVTDAGVHATRGAWTQSRDSAAGRRLATNLNGAMFALSPEQREVIASSKASDGVQVLGQRLRAMGNQNAVEAFVAYDEMATRFASMYAASQFEGELVRIQYMVGRRSVAGRHEETNVRDKAFAWFTFGARRPFIATYDQQMAFERHARVIS